MTAMTRNHVNSIGVDDLASISSRGDEKNDIPRRAVSCPLSKGDRTFLRFHHLVIGVYVVRHPRRVSPPRLTSTEARTCLPGHAAHQMSTTMMMSTFFLHLGSDGYKDSEA
jgi:hypothetical protein